jgi:hypothetical protein
VPKGNGVMLVKLKKDEIKIYQIHAFNLGGNFGKPLKKGCLAVLTDKEPDFIYEKIGPYLMAEHDGFVHCYKHVAGTKDGFAGREIKLRVKGGSVFKNRGHHYETFKGSLWDAYDAYKKYEELNNVKVFSIGQASYKAFSKCSVFGSCYVTGKRMREIIDNLAFTDETVATA